MKSCGAVEVEEVEVAVEVEVEVEVLAHHKAQSVP